MPTSALLRQQLLRCCSFVRLKLLKWSSPTSASKCMYRRTCCGGVCWQRSLNNSLCSGLSTKDSRTRCAADKLNLLECEPLQRYFTLHSHILEIMFEAAVNETSAAWQLWLDWRGGHCWQLNSSLMEPSTTVSDWCHACQHRTSYTTFTDPALCAGGSACVWRQAASRCVC